MPLESTQGEEEAEAEAEAEAECGRELLRDQGEGGGGGEARRKKRPPFSNSGLSTWFIFAEKDLGKVVSLNSSFADDHTNGYGLSAEVRPGGGDGGSDGGSGSGTEGGGSCGAMCLSGCRRRAREACTLKQLYKRVPILDWMPKYDRSKAVSDLIAGITVGLTVIPQGIAYALVAELPPEYGLYSAFMGCFMYAIFGSCKDVTVGPTAIMSLMTAEYAAQHGNPDYAVLAAFLAGIVIFVLGALRLGFVIDFISVPVTAGFTSAAAISIAAGQVDELLGLKKVETWEDEGIIGTAYEIVANIDTLRWEDTALGLSCAVVLLYMRVRKGGG